MVTLGVVPTPTVSFVARTGEYGLGAVISASHNPAPDNGIKFVGHDGRKLADEEECRIEELLGSDGARPTGGAVGWLDSDRSAVEQYLTFLESLVPEGLDGAHVALDAAHGAAYELGPEVLKRLGGRVSAIGVSPDGMNINAGVGATNPAAICRHTVECGADIGVAFDGDADRAIFSDERGELINGDRTIAIWSAHWRRHGGLNPAIVVGTVMSNGGFERYLRESSISLERTQVGDKYVAQKMTETGALVGGEQSGHIIFAERGPTGDGLVTMLELLRVLRREGGRVSGLCRQYENLPQVLVNVTVTAGKRWDEGETVRSAVQEGNALLDGRGRLVVRASGTQPMVRLMVEADTCDLRDKVADGVLSALKSEVGGTVYSRVDLTNALGD